MGFKVHEDVLRIPSSKKVILRIDVIVFVDIEC